MKVGTSAAGFAGCSVDSRNPQGMKIALLVAAIAIGILPARITACGNAMNVITTTAIAFGQRDDFLCDGRGRLHHVLREASFSPPYA